MLITPLLLAVLAQTAAPAPASTTANPPAAAALALPPGTFAPDDKTGPALPPNVLSLPDHGWMPLFNGENLDGWYTYRVRDGKNNDVQHVFKVENGTIHVLDVPDPATPQPNGYLATNEEFRNYRLRLEYKWGTVKFAVPRHPNGLPRDAGLLYHMTGEDKVWPMCVEFQIDEHTTGDVFLLPNNPPNPSADTTVVPNDDGTPKEQARGVYTYQEGGVWVTDHGQRIIRSAQFDTLDGWNTVELFATENSAVQVTNGHVNNFVRNLQLPNNGGPMTQGKILLQEENNEVFYRHVEIKPLFADRYGGPAYKVLFVGAPFDEAVKAIQQLGGENNFTADLGTPASFTTDNLQQYKAVVVFGGGIGNVNVSQQQALQDYIHAGGGFVAVGAAAEAKPNWDWYASLVGAVEDNSTAATATLKLVDPNHASTSSLPLTWSHADQWPNFKSPLDAKVHVVAAVDESTYSGGNMGANHPIAWCQYFEGGRSFYTALGSTKEDYSDPLFLIHLLGGICFAANTDGVAPPGATVLFDGTDTSHWLSKDNQPFPWIFERGIIYPPPATYPNGVRVMVGDIRSKETYTDFQLHVEFKVPGTNFDPFKQEQSRGNSGVYMQGRYENQVLDSYDHPIADKNDEGAIYGIKDADFNASLPAEVWQTYDITFHAARWKDGQKISNARVTSYLNGVRVQNDTEIPRSTQSSMLPEGPDPGPIALQDHLNKVEFRYVWVKPL
jgi:type 1 glutamine amidotransferase